jgi:hypothetical protein
MKINLCRGGVALYVGSIFLCLWRWERMGCVIDFRQSLRKVVCRVNFNEFRYIF